jgi:MoxR-like ATPase
MDTFSNPAPTQHRAQSADGDPFAWFARTFEAIHENVESVVHGKPDVVHQALVCLLAEGHLLVEDVPGVG